MEHRTIKMSILLVATISLIFSSCYYDKAETLKVLDNTVCDTVNVSFSSKIMPLITQSCTNGCHTGGSPSAGIALDNYNQILLTVNDGSLVGTVTHATGFAPMPQGAAKLSDCNIKLIKAWINQGAKNN